MSERKETIDGALRAILVPELRLDGFAGSGRTFRRLRDEWVQVLNIQGSRYGGAFAINLAIHPLAIPDCREQVPDPKKITQELCEFRRRLSEAGADHWWKYTPDAPGIEAAVTDAKRVYEFAGRKLFDQVSGPGSPMNTVTPAEFAAGLFDFAGFCSTDVRMALALSRLRRVQRQYDDSRAFAAYGASKAGHATSLRNTLEQLAER
jgi:hypothetical protein